MTTQTTDWHDRLFELRQRVLAMARRFNARPKRERVMLAVAAAAVLMLAGDHFWLTPAFRHFSAASQGLAAARQEQRTLTEESERRRVQGNAERKALNDDLAVWRQRTSDSAHQLADTQAGLIGPERMVAMLEQMLPRQGGVKVVSLTTLAPQDARASLPPMSAATPATAASGLPAGFPVLPPGLSNLSAALTAPATAPAAASAPAPVASAPAGPGNGSAPLYRHGVEITVEGNYGDLMNYLASLENLPGPRLLWGGMRLKVEHHPAVQLSLTVYTLSLDRAWLEL